MKKLLFTFSIFIHLFVAGQSSTSFEHNGISRNFIYYTPTSWTQGESVPLLFVLHGLTQSGAGIMSITDFNTIAEANNFIVCYPDGLNNSWNADMNITVSQADDIGFIEELAVFMQNDFNTDPNRQYLCGFSNGGFMSYKLACESNQCFAAIASVAGTMSDTVYQNCVPQYTPDILQIHGTADPVVSYDGGPTVGISVDALMEQWRAFYSCDLEPTMNSMPNTNILDLSYPERYTYTNCEASLELIKIIGGGHQWPGIVTLLGGLGTINMDFYSPQLIWEFLENKTCSETSSTIELKENPTKKILKIIDMMGRETKFIPNTPLIYIYSDGTQEKVMKLKH